MVDGNACGASGMDTMCGCKDVPGVRMDGRHGGGRGRPGSAGIGRWRASAERKMGKMGNLGAVNTARIRQNSF